jgi:hypothetical protein
MPAVMSTNAVERHTSKKVTRDPAWNNIVSWKLLTA